jgi:GT2 family glycosyltransferase
MIFYQKGAGVNVTSLGRRPVFVTPQGGRIASDPRLVALWERIDGRSLEEVLDQGRELGDSRVEILGALACLAEAGLIRREPPLETGNQKPPFVLGPLVSVVIVGFNSLEWLVECLPSLARQNYSPLEIIVVDNGSSDDPCPWLQNHHPEVKALRLEKSGSLSQAINFGVARSRGDFFLLLNPDILLDPSAVAHLVEIARQDPACAAVAAKLKLWWAPAFLNGLGNYVGPFSWGTDIGLGHLDLGQFDRWEEIPSACFAATLIPRSAWDKVGPVDEGFPLYYEDAEWCYRARSLGFVIRPAPRAVVLHAFGGRRPSGQADPLTPRKLERVAYGRLRFAYTRTHKLLPRFLRNYALEDLLNGARAFLRFDWPLIRAYGAAWLKFSREWAGLRSARAQALAGRVLPDEVLFKTPAELPPPLVWNGLPELSWDRIRTVYLPLIQSQRTRPMPEFYPSYNQPRLLIVSHDLVDTKMAGPGMRYLEMARALQRLGLEVTLAIPGKTSLSPSEVPLVSYDETRPDGLKVLVENHETTLISGYLIKKFPFLEQTRSRLVVDLYDPIVLENLHYYLKEPLKNQEVMNNQAVSVTNALARVGDFFICGNERQRDYWIGLLTANQRVNPRNFAEDSSLRRLIDVVGVGLPDREPRPHPLLRGLHPAIPPNARLVLWGGGIWNWLDPLTLVQAWPEVLKGHPEARLIFLGTRHPNPQVPVHEMAEKTQRLAAEVGEKDKTILFFEWLSYDDREALLCEADIGVTLHPVHLETRYSIRTRVLDYIWARLPILITEGDVTSEWVRQKELGAVVPPFDPLAVTRGLIHILDQPKDHWSSRFDDLRETLSWSSVVRPLQRYCLEGGYAPDRLERTAGETDAEEDINYLRHALTLWRQEGFSTLVHRTWRYLQWRLART